LFHWGQNKQDCEGRIGLFNYTMTRRRGNNYSNNSDMDVKILTTHLNYLGNLPPFSAWI
jgi:hypothetical protein